MKLVLCCLFLSVCLANQANILDFCVSPDDDWVGWTDTTIPQANLTLYVGQLLKFMNRDFGRNHTFKNTGTATVAIEVPLVRTAATANSVIIYAARMTIIGTIPYYDPNSANPGPLGTVSIVSGYTGPAVPWEISLDNFSRTDPGDTLVAAGQFTCGTTSPSLCPIASAVVVGTVLTIANRNTLFNTTLQPLRVDRLNELSQTYDLYANCGDGCTFALNLVGTYRIVAGPAEVSLTVNSFYDTVQASTLCQGQTLPAPCTPSPAGWFGWNWAPGTSVPWDRICANTATQPPPSTTRATSASVSGQDCPDCTDGSWASLTLPSLALLASLF